MFSSSLVSAFRKCVVSILRPANYTVQILGGPIRGYKRHHVPTMMFMKVKRKRAGPEPLRHRSVWPTWNYSAELYAFCCRLNENFSEETLKIALTHKSYIEEEEQKRRELGDSYQDVSLELKDNTELIHEGTKVMGSYIKAYLRHSYPALPEEGICATHDFLMSDQVLSHVSSNIGTKDIILCNELPPEQSTLAATFKALVGALARDQGTRQAEFFVLDFVLPQLIGNDIADIWEIANPLSVLQSILERHGREPPESRLLWETGRHTLEAAFLVGIYSNKQFLGQGAGETIGIAEEIAAHNSLWRMFKMDHPKPLPLPFGKEGRQLKLDKKKTNISVLEC